MSGMDPWNKDGIRVRALSGLMVGIAMNPSTALMSTEGLGQCHTRVCVIHSFRQLRSHPTFVH